MMNDTYIKMNSTWTVKAKDKENCLIVKKNEKIEWANHTYIFTTATQKLSSANKQKKNKYSTNYLNDKTIQNWNCNKKYEHVVDPN